MAAGSKSTSDAARHRVAANRLAELGANTATIGPAVEFRLAQRHAPADHAGTRRSLCRPARAEPVSRPVFRRSAGRPRLLTIRAHVGIRMAAPGSAGGFFSGQAVFKTTPRRRPAG